LLFLAEYVDIIFASLLQETLFGVETLPRIVYDTEQQVAGNCLLYA